MTSEVPPASRLGLVTDRRRLCAAAGRPLADAPALLRAQLDAAAEAGLGFFQLREPDLEGAALLSLTRQFVAAARGRTRVMVNDRADVAVMAGAGIHLKHASIDAASLRRWMPPGTWITRAVHGVADVAAAGPVDALIGGTASASASKRPGSPTLGPAGLRALVAASATPVFAIGGLRPGDWDWLAEAGVFGCAAIGAFLPGPGDDPGAAVARAVRAFVSEIDASDRRY